MEKNIVLSTAYLPPVDFFKSTGGFHFCLIDPTELYQKQTYRNRTYIYSPNGIQPLIIPILRPYNGIIKDVKIDYKMAWQRNHWRSIQTAYNNSPFFEFYQDFFAPFFYKKTPFLFDHNFELIQMCNKLLKNSFTIYSTLNPNDASPIQKGDLLLPKKPSKFTYKPYNQVFSDKFGFIPNLSILDLLFNIGPDSFSYIMSNLNTNE
jgi:hypothetical protein